MWCAEPAMFCNFRQGNEYKLETVASSVYGGVQSLRRSYRFIHVHERGWHIAWDCCNFLIGCRLVQRAWDVSALCHSWGVQGAWERSANAHSWRCSAPENVLGLSFVGVQRARDVPANVIVWGARQPETLAIFIHGCSEPETLYFHHGTADSLRLSAHLHRGVHRAWDSRDSSMEPPRAAAAAAEPENYGMGRRRAWDVPQW
jgi:hypothetical protein